MFKYSPINSYSLQNLQKNQIYFNNPLNFNDPFDTFHSAEIQGLSNNIFAKLFCKNPKNNFDEKIIEKILDKKISKKEFYDFSKEHIEYFLDFNEEHNDPIYRNKENYLKSIKERSDGSISQDIEELLSDFRANMDNIIHKNVNETRETQLAELGICCFSKNNTNLLMWSHYGDSHKGMCLEFDSSLIPFSKSFEVIYGTDLPTINSDSMVQDELSFDFLEKLLSYKSIDWKHEEEIRIIHRENNKAYTYPRQALKSIFFGLRTSQTDIEIICSLVKTHNPHVRFYQMKRFDSKFKISPIEIFYSTPVEVQTKILMEISNFFKLNRFKLEELHDQIKIHIDLNNLKSHLDELFRVGVLERIDDYYQLKVQKGS